MGWYDTIALSSNAIVAVKRFHAFTIFNCGLCGRNQADFQEMLSFHQGFDFDR
jgi:hypothetical protein